MLIVRLLLAGGVLVASIAGFSIQIPGAAKLFVEDALMEWLSAIASFAAFAVAAMLLFDPDKRSIVVAAIAALALLAGLSELSFGERLFNFTPPSVVGVKIDAPHDFLVVAVRVIKSVSDNPWAVALAGISIALAGFIWSLWRSPTLRTWLTTLQGAATFAAICFVSTAMLIDLHVLPLPKDWSVLGYIEEACELTFGLLLLLAALASPKAGPESGVEHHDPASY